MKWRLFAAFAALVAMVLLAQDIPLASYLRDTEYNRVLAGLERDAFLIAGTSEDLLSGETTPDEVAATTERLEASIKQYVATGGGRVVIVDAEAGVVVSSDADDQAGDDFSNRPEFVSALAGDPATGERTSQDVGDLVYVAVPVISGGTVVGAVRITFAASVVDDRVNEKTRGLLLVQRAIPSPVWALMLLFVFFPGVLPGALALGIYNLGVLGRLMAESVENMDERPLRSLQALGTGRVRAFLYGVLPLTAPRFTAYTLYRWEIVIRETVVVGLVGAGGLGRLLAEQLSSFDYSGVAVTLLFYIALTFMVDLASASIRKAYR